MNWVGDQWIDVGDWKQGDTGLEKFHDILFPGGTTTAPSQERTTAAGACATSGDCGNRIGYIQNLNFLF